MKADSALLYSWISSGLFIIQRGNRSDRKDFKLGNGQSKFFKVLTESRLTSRMRRLVQSMASRQASRLVLYDSVVVVARACENSVRSCSLTRSQIGILLYSSGTS
jgi:hypothetical protein